MCTSNENQVVLNSLRDMDVIPMCVKEEIAYEFPGAFFSGPGPKELDRETIGLRPAPAGLQAFIESPSQVVSSFFVHYRSPCNRTIRASNALLRFVPTPFPNIKSEATNRINVSCTSNLVMPEDPGLEKEPDSFSVTNRRYVTSKPIQYSLQLMSKFRRDQRVLSRRVDPKVLPRTNRHSNIAAATWSRKSRSDDYH
jgi:hypothetical protein